MKKLSEVINKLTPEEREELFINRDTNYSTYLLHPLMKYPIITDHMRLELEVLGDKLYLLYYDFIEEPEPKPRPLLILTLDEGIDLIMALKALISKREAEDLNKYLNPLEEELDSLKKEKANAWTTFNDITSWFINWCVRSWNNFTYLLLNRVIYKQGKKTKKVNHFTNHK